MLPAESTRTASIWSSRVSMPTTGSTIVRSDGIVTVVYTAMPNTNAPVIQYTESNEETRRAGARESGARYR